MLGNKEQDDRADRTSNESVIPKSLFVLIYQELEYTFLI